MRLISMSIGVLLAGASLTWAFDEPEKKPPPAKSPASEEDSEKTTDKSDEDKSSEGGDDEGEDEQSVADQIQAIQTDLAKKQQAAVREYRAAKDDEERQKIILEFNELQASVTEKYLAIVKKHPDDKDLFPALQALVNSGERMLAIDLLLKHHLDDPQLGMLCFQLGRQGAPGSEKLLRAVAEKSKSDDAKGLALLALGQSLFAQSNQKGLDDAKREKLREEAETALKTVVDQYAEANVFGRKAGDMAGGVLFEVQHLAIGQEVPELEGKDLEGTVFKLSDYRGKVVFLDFWAHW